MSKYVRNPWLSSLLSIVVLGAAIGGVSYFASQHPIQKDITQNAINSLDATSLKVLKQLQGPVKLTVYATEKDAELGDIRKFISDFVRLYQRYKPDIQLTFVDPKQHPEQAKTANIQMNGELVIEYAGRSEHLTQLSEQVLTSTFLRLAHSRDLAIMYLDGHGERKLDGKANADFGIPFGEKLKGNGYKISPLNLTIAPDVPQNASLLVVTQPQIDILPGELDKIARYIDRGGNLLWLTEPTSQPHGLEQISDKLGLQFPDGMVIDPAANQMNAPANWAIGAAYAPQHPITRDFNLVTAFPNTRAILWNEGSDWQHKILVEIPDRAWVSRAKPNEAIEFDKKRDIPGPAVIALALQRPINEREQRVVVIGSSDFLSNSFSGNGGNIDFGISVINWLSSEDNLITLQPKAVKDTQLTLSQTQLLTLSGAFLVALPLFYILGGVILWWRRRKG